MKEYIAKVLTIGLLSGMMMAVFLWAINGVPSEFHWQWIVYPGTVCVLAYLVEDILKKKI